MNLAMSSLLYLLVPYYVGSEIVSLSKGDDVFLNSISNSNLLLESVYPGIINKVKDLFDFGLDDFQDNSTDSSECSQQLLQFWKDLDSERQAAYLDSFGKVGPGILTGNVRYLGYYDQCIDIGNTDYCRFPFDVTINTATSSNTSVTIRAPFEFGMCFPSSCDAKDFYDLFFIDSDEVSYSKSFIDVNAMNYTMNVMASIEYTEPSCPWRDLDWSNSSIIVLTVCVLLIVLVIIGTMTDVSFWFINEILPKLYLSEIEPIEPPETIPSSTSCEVKHSINEDEPLINAKHKPKASQSVAEKRFIEFVKDVILSFSLYKNVPAIMATHQPASAITSINGIRVIGMLWVILGHTFLFERLQDVMANSKEAFETAPRHFLFQLVVNFTFSVDIFFILSGVLLSYLSIKDMERRQGKFPFVSFYVHRLVRLSPANYLSVFIFFKVLPHVGSGPLWSYADVRHCEKYWWTSILYINNFYPVSSNDICHNVTWYLSIIMQFFIISPIFLLLLYHCWKIALVTIVGTMLVSIAIIGTLAGIEDFMATLFLQGAKSSWDIIYDKPHCRINAYLIGIVLGFVLYKKWRLRSSLWIRICLYSVIWITAAALCAVIIFGQYNTWRGHPFTKTENVMYYMFGRTGYSIGIALMIYACHNGFGGVINKFLSWSFWVPLSNLTFTAYLFHPLVFLLMYRTMRFRFIHTDWMLIILFSAAAVLSYSLALIVAVTVEYPVANVEKAVFKFIGVKRRK